MPGVFIKTRIWSFLLLAMTTSEKMKKEDEDGRQAKDTIPDYSKMKTISDFGYGFNEDGELRDIESGERFRFDVHGAGKTTANQRRYEALGEVITEHVYELLEKEGLQRITIPVEAKADEPRGFVFATPGVESASDLLVLIHGSGVVRAGQWARRLIINDNLDSGTQLPYIREAKARGWAVLVLNTNYNHDPNHDNRRIPGSQSADQHGCYVWSELVKKYAAERIAIVAHSAGGYVTGAIASENDEDFRHRVKAIAFTDSFCSPNAHITKVGRNWVTSHQPLNADLRQGGVSRVPEFSAGTSVHEETSYAAMEPIWDFLDSAMPPETIRSHTATTTPSHERHSTEAGESEEPASKRPRVRVGAELWKSRLSLSVLVAILFLLVALFLFYFFA